MLAPSGMGVFPDDSATGKRPSSPATTEKHPTPTGETARKTPLTVNQFGRRMILMKTRARVTKDAGASILVVESESESESESEDSGESD